MLTIAGIDLELFQDGSGAPLLLLHAGRGFDARDAYVAGLAKTRRVVAPSHPGFGQSSLPLWLDDVEDIAHVYLELMDALGIARADLVGCSIGGWIAAEMATKAPDRFNKLVLVGPVGVKTGPADKLDIPDIFAMAPDKLEPLLMHDPQRWRRDPASLSDGELAAMVRNWETLALLTWEPYMHNPKLNHRLHRVTNPALFLRGEHDGMISADYLARYAALLPNARVDTIKAAGHVPHIEQAEAFVATVTSFLEG
jgi:pimeloyl-ACP methyl ester carboxylesterase